MRTNCSRPALLSAVLAAALAGCNAGDNQSEMMKNSDGTPTKVENEGGPRTYTSSEEAYKATSGQNLMKTKGYRR